MATAPPDTTPANLSQRSEFILSLALLGILFVLMVPLPGPLLDTLLAFNLGLTIVVMLITLGARRPLDFSVFPSLLLLMTLFRLALNVATTRLILLRGDAGVIVEAFGHVIVGGSLVVGLVVFLILVIIQFVVITKGAGRISEVAARFTLDALPGKQMAIDAELNARAIDEPEARRRRGELARETEFYGAMDGASKFVRGDAVAGLIITAVNLIGGIIIGLTRGLPVGQAIQRYSVLTIGDGLVSQIPALIIATAAGMLVTKATSQASLGQEIGAQVTASARPLTIAALIMLGLAAVPGLPKLPFVILAGLLYLGGRRLVPPPAPVPLPAPGAPAGGEAPGEAQQPAEIPLDEFLQTDRAGVEIGARLIPLVDPRRGPGLIDRIGGLRRDLARKNGLWVPPLRVRDNLQLDPDAYRILVGGREVARGTLRPSQWLAIEAGGTRLSLDGEATQDPAFGLPARWISDTDRQRAELAGYTVVDAGNVLITHLGEVLRRHAHELLGREDLKALVDRVRETAPSLVDELIPGQLSMGTLHRVVGLLLEEHVPISNLTRILESLSSHVGATKDPAELAERVRADLGRAVCDRFRDEQGRLHAVVLDPRLQQEMMRPDRSFFLDPQRLERFIVRAVNEWRKAGARGQDVALLCDAALRRTLRQTLRAVPDLAVIAFQEVPSDLVLEPEAVLRPEDLAG